MVDAEGFQYKYVPKDSIITDDNISPNKAGKKNRKGSKASDSNKYVYLKKSPAPSTASDT